MNEALSIAIAIASAYLLGSIPSAYIVGRLKKGVDIRQIGSQNMGAMNTFYKVGITSGLLVLAVDIGKGTAAVALARWLGVPPIIEMLAGTNAVIGHGFPVWLNFRGGKGGATLIGVLFFFHALGHTYWPNRLRSAATSHALPHLELQHSLNMLSFYCLANLPPWRLCSLFTITMFNPLNQVYPSNKRDAGKNHQLASTSPAQKFKRQILA